ncbi:hypothetical protein AOQ84DRAFT_226471 [Glonium stellatum]|uniref:Uncharacterized protein n=1 Tax=Glonium stellatum TaxID=574774 RepID=A0A8E2JP94_9PEZI|nr:hypothetical protein AOQ84DRAFT_226471 [Glonium stellatum]
MAYVVRPPDASQTAGPNKKKPMSNLMRLMSFLNHSQIIICSIICIRRLKLPLFDAPLNIASKSLAGAARLWFPAVRADLVARRDICVAAALLKRSTCWWPWKFADSLFAVNRPMHEAQAHKRKPSRKSQTASTKTSLKAVATGANKLYRRTDVVLRNGIRWRRLAKILHLCSAARRPYNRSSELISASTILIATRSSSRGVYFPCRALLAPNYPPEPAKPSLCASTRFSSRRLFNHHERGKAEGAAQIAGQQAGCSKR